MSGQAWYRHPYQAIDYGATENTDENADDHAHRSSNALMNSCLMHDPVYQREPVIGKFSTSNIDEDYRNDQEKQSADSAQQTMQRGKQRTDQLQKNQAGR